MDSSVKSLLLNYNWPGNVRELENVIEYAINMAASNTTHLPDIPDRLKAPHHDVASAGTNMSAFSGTLKEQLAVFEQSIIEAALDKYGRSLEGKRKAAEELNISESTLYRRLR